MEQEKDKKLQDLARALDAVLAEIYGVRVSFALFTFLPETTQADFISNADRRNMLDAIAETHKRLSAGEDIPPTIGGIQ